MSIDEEEGHEAHGFEFLTDPVLVVSLSGNIREKNEAANALFGSALSGGVLARLLANADDDCSDYVRSAAGSSAPRPGKLRVVTRGGIKAFRTEAARSHQSTGAEVRIILRFLPPVTDHLAVLDRRVRELDAQLAKRFHENAALTAALNQNQMLLRELQHRVKNNIQQMLTLVRMAARRHDAPEAAAFFRTSVGRLQAMATAQEALYQAAETDSAMSKSLLEQVVRTVAAAHNASDTISMSLDDAWLSSEEAHCLSLIAYELVSNAAAHGRPNGQGRISVTFTDEGEHCRFEVEDSGPGILELELRQASGLALVNGLCRQIGGRLEIGAGRGGARCSVNFPPDRERRRVN